MSIYFKVGVIYACRIIFGWERRFDIDYELGIEQLRQKIFQQW